MFCGPLLIGEQIKSEQKCEGGGRVYNVAVHFFRYIFLLLYHRGVSASIKTFLVV